MNHRRIAVALFSCSVLALSACGGSSKKTNLYDGKAVTPPANPNRTLPTAGPPDSDAGPGFPDVSPADVAPPTNFAKAATDAGEGGNCCPVKFAIADPHPGVHADWGHLVGTISPLNTANGVDLTLANGVWSATACVPPSSYGTFHFEFAYPATGGGQPYLESDISPYVPTTTGPDGVANQWTSAQDCASVDTAMYAKTSAD